jgi:hypothetical protein
MKFLIVSLILSVSVFAGYDATVKMVKGTVTVLRPGTHDVIHVKKGDTIPQNSSILTGAKSIVKLRFKDKSIVSLGPNSKIIVDKSKKKEKNIISLLKGVIRAEVKKTANNSKNKMLIKTRTAVMGIRGTTLKASYNPINTNTSLVTIEGDVVMAKVDKDPVIEVFKENADVKDLEAAIEKKMERKLASTESVHVKNGRFAGVIKDHKKPTEPVKIASKQLVAMTQNDELADATNTQTKEEIIEESNKFDEEDPAANGVDNKLVGELAGRAGGFIDFGTGIYVEPTKEAVFNEETHVYIDKKEATGTISKAGDYVPPKGIKLDAKKGFVVDNVKEVLVVSNDLSIIKETLAKLNNTVAKQVKQKSYAKITYKDFKKYLPQNHFISISARKLTADYIIKPDSGGNLKVNTENGEVFNLTLHQVWSAKNATYVSFRHSTIELEDKNPNMNLISDTNLKSMQAFILGYKRRVSTRVELDLYFGYDNKVFFETDGGVNVTASAQEFEIYGIGLNYFIYENDKITFFAHTHYNNYVANNNSENSFGPSPLSGFADDGSEFQINGTLNYAYKPDLKLQFLTYFSMQNGDTDRGWEVNRQAVGLGTGMIWDY